MECSRVVAEVKFLPIYNCSKCGHKEQGTTQRTQIDTFGLSEMINQLETTTLSPNNMPIGWSSNYSPKGTCFRCQKCTEVS